MGTTTVYQIQPLQDARWVELVDRHPRSSVFHTVAWLDALNRTYGYQPTAFTTSPLGERLEDGLVFCRVNSWITGRRLISLPFSDHCDPLSDHTGHEAVFTPTLEETLRLERLRYIESRPTCPLSSTIGPWHSTVTYCLHRLDLRPDLATLFGEFHKDCTQRKILRAQREALIYETGRSQALLEAFCHLLLLTRRRHRIPPQPNAWFRNLIDCFGEALQIRVAFKDKQAVAAILTLRHKDTLIYKYGCSDARFSNLGGTQLLFWRCIEEAKRAGLCTFDLGRTDCDNVGLIAFKDRWGSTRSTMTYSRISASPAANREHGGKQWAEQIARGIVPRLPDRIFRMVGRVFYRHIA